jgi:Cytochrome P450
MTVRQSSKNHKLGEYFVPARTTIYCLANVINRMPEYWGPTANDYNPDSWDNLPTTYTPKAFMTFLQYHGDENRPDLQCSFFFALFNDSSYVIDFVAIPSQRWHKKWLRRVCKR